MTAFSGLRIADFSRILAGPFATMLLADFGTEVIKIERPGGGDDTRSWGPPYASDGSATYFLSVNRNKHSVVLDLASAQGRRQAQDLAVEAGIVVENFRPGVMDRLGLGYEDLVALRPDLIYCSISAFGSGAGARLPGYDLIVQAAGGLMSITGPRDGEPQKVGVAVVDVITGLFAALGIAAAVRHREQTGEGQRIEVDLLSCALSALTNQAAGYTAGGVVPTRLGNEHPSIAPYETLPTGDGELAVAVGNDKQFRSMCEVLQSPGMADDPRFATNPARVAHRAALREELAARLSLGPTAEWVDRLSRAGVPAGPVNDLAAAFDFARSLGLEPTVDIGGTTLPRNPLRMEKTPASYRLPPPRLAGSDDPCPPSTTEADGQHRATGKNP
ncbi:MULTISPECIES: CaiB/BaiF CoA transferase family protein [unclassified Streptomyces]|uniref:CaiB/BaiF CoA transferase family protein n=1 Tax=unclassified Streptomyces TaxID=2593676 RepID=UPI002DD84D48|nr:MULTISPECIES: CoA transferase [unclassified Streptomyces]WSA05030.1 CoA transferase [Streptomyces sp. NBC_00841]WSJ91947.1 CoA transferase [Streptomyces sp. NBC_01320]WSK01140.1 CoA transferase [Streptomyces sp. NBC_01320]